MGCLNYNSTHRAKMFANIHLSGPCNRSCYYCIGQHMMDLDSINNLDVYPLKHMRYFVDACIVNRIKDIYVTGSNTDPMLYKHTRELRSYIIGSIPEVKFGIRTNGVSVLAHPEIWGLYDKASISITSMNPDIYVKTMGCGKPPELLKILSISPNMDIKVNIVLCPEILVDGDLMETLSILNSYGIKRVNLREPYGQANIGDPLEDYLSPIHMAQETSPTYLFGDMEVTYWDVHYVYVQSINLYANGVLSYDYPITLGHSPENGKVLAQSNFVGHKRRNAQWL